MESNEYIFIHLRKEIEEKVSNLPLNEEFIYHVKNGNVTQNIIEKLNLKDFETELYTKYNAILQLPCKNVSDNKEHDLWMQLNTYDFEDDYGFPLETFSNLSQKAKLEALDELLTIQIIDTKQENWPVLSKHLAHCFVCSNEEIFLHSLKVLYRIIHFPGTACDGYLTLLKGGLILFTCRLGDYTNSCNNMFKQRVLKVTRLSLKSLNLVVRNMQNVKIKVLEEVITSLISFFMEDFRSNKFPCKVAKLIDIVGHLDQKADWFKVLSFGTNIREVFMKLLLQQKVLKLILSVFLQSVEHINNFHTETDLRILSHTTFCLMYVLKYPDNIRYFPINIKSGEKFSAFDILEQIIIFSKNHQITAEVRDILKSVIVEVSSNNLTLFYNTKLLVHLIDSFRFHEKKCPLIILENNFHVFDIINAVIKIDNNILFTNLNKFHKPKLKRYKIHSGCISYRVHINYPQIIVDFTITLLKRLSNNKNINRVTDSGTVLLLECCTNIFHSNSASFFYVNTKKLLTALKNVYDNLIENQVAPNEAVLRLFSCLFENVIYTFESIEHDQVAKDIVDQIIEKKCYHHFATFICNIAQSNLGFGIVRSSHNLIIKTTLEKLWWKCESENFINTDDFQAELYSFIQLLFALTTSSKVIRALLTYENEDTIVENDDKCTTLADLIQKCLNTSIDSEEMYTGLLILKVLISNIDIYLYLESDYKIQEKLTDIHSHCQATSTSDESIAKGSVVVIDACSSLRHNILNTIDCIGFVNHNLNHVFLEQTDIASDYTEVSSQLRTGGKSPNELQKFMNHITDEIHDQTWLLQARRAFKLTCSESYNVSVIVDLLEQLPKTFVYRKINLVWPPSDSVYHQLFGEDLVGTAMIVRYGMKVGLFNSSEKNEENLNLLIKQSRTFLCHYPEHFMGYDWFVGIIFLICSGNMETSKKALVSVTNTNVTSLVWYTFGKEFDYIFQENFYLQLRIIIEENNPTVYAALEELGIPIIDLIKKWLSQCFFNVLDFEEICNFIVFTVLFPPEALIFYTLAIFEHIKTGICTSFYSATAENLLKATQLESFKLTNYLTFIEKYLKQYRNIIKL